MTCRIKDFSAIKSFFFSGRYCLQSIPRVIVSRGHELYIHFRARSKAKSNLTRRFKGNFLSHTTGTDMHYQNGDFFFSFFFFFIRLPPPPPLPISPQPLQSTTKQFLFFYYCTFISPQHVMNLLVFRTEGLKILSFLPPRTTL